MSAPTENGVNGQHDKLANGHSNGVDDGQSHEGDRFGTRLIHVGSEANKETGAVIPPISLSTTFRQESIGVHKGYEYTRSLNPTRLSFEALIASLEGGYEHPAGSDPLDESSLPGGLAFASGSAVTAVLIQGLVGEKGHVVSVSDVYGGTYRYLTKVATAAQGVETTFVDMSSSSIDRPGATDEEVESEIAQRIEQAFRPNTKLVWVETPTNPTLRLVDIALVARVAHTKGALLVVDNTFATPYYQKPLELGADIVVHSVTKYINGHSDVLAGAIVARSSALVNRLRFLQNAFGAVPSAFDSWLALRGAKTLELRMRQHGLSALKIAQWLRAEGKSRGLIREVIYAGIGSGYGDYERGQRIRKLAWRQVPKETKEWIQEQGFDGETGDFPYGGMVSFRIASAQGADDSEEALGQAAEKFLTSTRLFTLAESLGGVESLAEAPGKMTHAAVSAEDRAKLGIDHGLIRLSVGIEDTRDLLKDLEQALQKAAAVSSVNGKQI